MYMKSLVDFMIILASNIVKDFSKLNVKCQNETSESNSKSFSLHSFMFNNSFDVKSYVYNLQEIQKYNYVLTQEISYQKSSKQDKLIICTYFLKPKLCW